MSRPVRPHYQAVDFGPLPTEKVNIVLGTELEPGNVRLSKQAHKHIAEDHPNDYYICFPVLQLAVASPSFIGQAPGHSANFEIIRRINREDGKEVLVAIGLKPDADGCYRITSAYLVSRETVEQRRQAKRLKPSPP